MLIRISKKVGQRIEQVHKGQLFHYLEQKDNKALLVCHGDRHGSGRIKYQGKWAHPETVIRYLAKHWLRKEVTKVFILCCNASELQPFEVEGIQVRSMFPDTNRVGVKRRGNGYFLRTVAL